MRKGSVVALVCAVWLAACQTGARQEDETATPSPITGEAIEVTPLAAVEPAVSSEAPVAEADPQPEPGTLAPPLAEPKSSFQIDCERTGGRWVLTGVSGSRACVTPTRDGGKQCTRETDCEGLCLARSKTCAPIDPIFGCTDILQANGQQVTLCID